jgi:hypothetical protein
LVWEFKGQAFEHQTRCLGASSIAVEQAWGIIVFVVNAGITSEYSSQYVSFNDFYNSCIQFALLYMYLGICVSMQQSISA